MSAQKTKEEYIAELEAQIARTEKKKTGRTVIYSINANISNAVAQETDKHFTTLGYIVVKTKCTRCENKWSMSITIP